VIDEPSRLTVHALHLQAPLETKPFHFLVRVADNLDAQNMRLTLDQRYEREL